MRFVLDKHTKVQIKCTIQSLEYFYGGDVATFMWVWSQCGVCACDIHCKLSLSAARNCRLWRRLAIFLLHYVIELILFTSLDQCTCMYIVKPAFLFVSNFYAIYQQFYTNAIVHVFGSCCAFHFWISLFQSFLFSNFFYCIVVFTYV